MLLIASISIHPSKDIRDKHFPTGIQATLQKIPLDKI